MEKNSANKFGRKTGFKIENEIEDQDQSIPKLIGILTQVFCTFGPNLVILAWTGDELSCREAQNGVTFDFEVKFDLEGQGQSPPKTIGILTKVFNTYGPNLVILAWKGDELLRGQASDYRTQGRTDTQTDAGNDNTRRPKLASGKNKTKHYYALDKSPYIIYSYPLLWCQQAGKLQIFLVSQPVPRKRLPEKEKKENKTKKLMDFRVRQQQLHC